MLPILVPIIIISEYSVKRFKTTVDSVLAAAGPINVWHDLCYRKIMGSAYAEREEKQEGGADASECWLPAYIYG
jgi:hypothetical protein